MSGIMVDGRQLKKQMTDRAANSDLPDGEKGLRDSIDSSAVRHPDATVSLDNSSDINYLQEKKLPST